MTTAPEPIDLRARALHATALAHLSPQVLARLRQARHAAAASPRHSRRVPGWLAGSGALAAALAVAVVLWPRHAPPDAPATVAATLEVAAPLQEDPGFYLWLASADAPLLALE